MFGGSIFLTIVSLSCIIAYVLATDKTNAQLLATDIYETKVRLLPTDIYKTNAQHLARLNQSLEFKKLGCWKDTPERALLELEGKSSILDGSPQARLDPLVKCYKAAKASGYLIFSLQYGGQCFAGNGLSYQKYGQSSDCNADGRGGTWANEVYEASNRHQERHELKKLGCWKDTPERALIELEGKSSILDGSPQQRSDPLGKCSRAARERGFEIFSLQYGGQCFAGNGLSYQRFGKSNDCNADGRGGTWANEVYAFKFSRNCHTFSSFPHGNKV